MSVTTTRSVAFTTDSSPTSSLSPTCTVKDMRSGQVIATNVAMTEDTDVSGVYTYQFSGHENHEYILKADAGVDTVDVRYPIHTFVLVDEQPHRGSFQQGSPNRKFSDQQMDEVRQLLKIEVPEAKADEAFLKSAKATEKQLKKLESLTSLESKVEGLVNKLGASLDDDLSRARASLEDTIESMQTKAQQENLDLIDQLTDVLDNLRIGNDDLSSSRGALDTRIKDLAFVTVDDVKNLEQETLAELASKFDEKRQMRLEQFEKGGQNAYSQEDFDALEQETAEVLSGLIADFVEFKDFLTKQNDA